MELQYEYFLDSLNKKGVSVAKRAFVTINDTKYDIGAFNREAYINEEQDIARLKEDLPKDYADAILTLWGQLDSTTDSQQTEG